jgi:hypothetical protein
MGVANIRIVGRHAHIYRNAFVSAKRHAANLEPGSASRLFAYDDYAFWGLGS